MAFYQRVVLKELIIQFYVKLDYENLDLKFGQHLWKIKIETNFENQAKTANKNILLSTPA